MVLQSGTAPYAQGAAHQQLVQAVDHTQAARTPHLYGKVNYSIVGI